MLRMVDRATPPTDDEIVMLRSMDVAVVLVYVSGETDGGHAWDGYDLAKLSEFRLLPCFVGQNKPWTANETAAQGDSDGDATVETFAARGFRGGPALLDLEAQTYDLAANGTRDYGQHWGERVRRRGFTPVIYQPLNMAQQRTCPNMGALIAYWTGESEPQITQLAINPSAYQGVGWQWTDSWHGFDASLVPESWWESMDQSLTFDTGHSLAGGFLAFWATFGGETAYGKPISQEYDTTGQDGQPVRRQWTERAVLEWRDGQYPAHYDVLPVLLGDLLRDGNTDALDRLHMDTVQYADAFAVAVAS